MHRIQFFKWLPALLTMAVIFWFSSQPSSDLPNFGLVDRVIKKTGHVFEFAVLSFWVWYALEFRSERVRLAWLIAFLYAITDEIHQSYVPGRNPSVWDVIVFDNAGAWISLWLAQRYLKKRPAGLTAGR